MILGSVTSIFVFLVQRDMLNINQAVHTFYPSFNKPFLTEYTLSRIHDMFEASTKHNRALYFNQNFKKRLECEIKKNDCVLANCFTRQGLFIGKQIRFFFDFLA